MGSHKKKNLWLLLKMERQTLFRTFPVGMGTTWTQLCNGERDLVHLQLQHEQVGIYSQGTEQERGWEDGGQRMENYLEKTSGVRSFLAKPS